MSINHDGDEELTYTCKPSHSHTIINQIKILKRSKKTKGHKQTDTVQSIKTRCS